MKNEALRICRKHLRCVRHFLRALKRHSRRRIFKSDFRSILLSFVSGQQKILRKAEILFSVEKETHLFITDSPKTDKELTYEHNYKH